MTNDKVVKTDQEWREQSTPEQYHITREKGTEAPFTGTYYYSKEDGVYCCSSCNNKLFSSEVKYESGSGWPSFYQPLHADAIEERDDMSLGEARTEVVCGRCDAHLGHVFPDGPAPTGLRYCINSVALSLEKNKP